MWKVFVRLVPIPGVDPTPDWPGPSFRESSYKTEAEARTHVDILYGKSHVWDPANRRAYPISRVLEIWLDPSESEDKSMSIFALPNLVKLGDLMEEQCRIAAGVEQEMDL